jgi:hypothetical protein
MSESIQTRAAAIIDDNEHLYDYFQGWDNAPSFTMDFVGEIVFLDSDEWDTANLHLYGQSEAFEEDDHMRMLLREFSDTGLLNNLGELLEYLAEKEGE